MHARPTCGSALHACITLHTRCLTPPPLPLHRSPLLARPCLYTPILTHTHTELGQKPDLIIGNYSDGNLVASLLAHRMFVTQCNIAHAIEKTKYQDADIKW